ncbi:MAG TPA: hypothetical protein V6C69_07775 [Trichormus sp.]|jgi:hypothetical protein
MDEKLICLPVVSLSSAVNPAMDGDHGAITMVLYFVYRLMGNRAIALNHHRGFIATRKQIAPAPLARDGD